MSIVFALPHDAEATAPPEESGTPRDGVRLMAVRPAGITHSAFRDLPSLLDPGDMNTAMHQAAFPGEDIGDRPAPETVVPALLRLLDEPPPSGRYRAAELAPVGAPR